MLPQTMTVIETRESGGPEVLVPGTRPVPLPAPDEVLIVVEAAGINRPDVLQRQGLYPAPKGASDLLGPRSGRRRRGRRRGCHALQGRRLRLRPGQWRRLCRVRRGAGIDHPARPATAWTRCKPPPSPKRCSPSGTTCSSAAVSSEGGWLLVHGGASGIGTTAIQLATALGAKVIVTVGSAEKAKACEALGAVRAINYHEGRFRRCRARGDRRPWRRRHPRHGRRRLYRAQFEGGGAGRPHRADRLPEDVESRDRPDASDDAPAHPHRLDPARADAGSQVAHGASHRRRASGR